jgi:CDP-2,3-bis-(O-geranylgeranyl)-sn-glycerol synthase
MQQGPAQASALRYDASMQSLAVLQVLLLLAVANGTPVIVKRLLGPRLAGPIDFGRRLPDGRPVFGPSKTWRGLLLAIFATSLAAAALDLGWRLGLLVGALAMLGDLLSSFTKRRLGRASSSRALGLDQIPESLLPLIACRGPLGLDWLDVMLGTAVFLLGEILLSRWLYRLRIRDQPY